MVGTSPEVSVLGGEVADVISGTALWVWAVIEVPWSMAVVMKAAGLVALYPLHPGLRLLALDIEPLVQPFLILSREARWGGGRASTECLQHLLLCLHHADLVSKIFKELTLNEN